MRKRTITPAQPETASPDDEWLDLETLADVEITSEDAAHPIESALLPGRSSGWRAAAPGKQTIRLLFTRPQRLKRIWLSFWSRPQSAHRNTSCVGRRMADSRIETSCGNSGTSARQAQRARRKIIASTYRQSPRSS